MKATDSAGGKVKDEGVYKNYCEPYSWLFGRGSGCHKAIAFR